MSKASRRSIEHLGQTLRYHEMLLHDRARNHAFRRALAACIRPGDRVLDVGTGSGVWAVVAARLGARKVVAVEREPLLVPITRQVIADSGVAHRVELVAGEFRTLRLAREFDVIVSETVGNFLFEEDVVSIMAAARAQCLVPGGLVVPEAVGFLAAPARMRRRLPEPVSLPVSLRSFRDHLVQFPRYGAWSEIDLVGRPVELDRVALATVPATRTALGRVNARWRLPRPITIDVMAAWLRLDLAPGIRLDVRRCTNWPPLLFAMDERRRLERTLALALDHSPRRAHWRIEAGVAGGGTVTEEHCPELAYGSVRAARRSLN